MFRYDKNTRLMPDVKLTILLYFMHSNIFYDGTELPPDPQCNTAWLFPVWNVLPESLPPAMASHDSEHWSVLSVGIGVDERSQPVLSFRSAG